MMRPLELLTLLFNRFDELDVQKRVLLMRDRSVAVRNITAISVDRMPLYPFILALLLPGLFVAAGAIGSVMFGGGAADGWVDGLIMQSPWLLLALLLTGLFWYLARRRQSYLMISSADGAQHAFGSRDVELLRGVKAALDDKINNQRVEVTFFANFAVPEGRAALAPSPDVSERISDRAPTGAGAGAVLSSSLAEAGRTILRANGCAACQDAGLKSGMADCFYQWWIAALLKAGFPEASHADQGADDLPWYDKMFDLPLTKSNEVLSKFAAGAAQENGGGVVSLVNEVSQPMKRVAASGQMDGDIHYEADARAMNGQMASAVATNPQQRRPVAASFGNRAQAVHSNVVGFGYPEGGAAQAALTPMWEARDSSFQDHSAPDKGMGEAERPVASTAAVAAPDDETWQAADLVDANEQRPIDYSAHIPNVKTIRREVTDPIITGKLDEMITLMEAGTPGEAEKTKLRAHALTLAGYVRAYPQIARIFGDILDTAAT